MAQQRIITTPLNSGDGTPLATAFDYCNSNFSELYARAQTTPPGSLIGNATDEPGMYAYDSTYFYYCFAHYNGVDPIWGQVTQVGNVTVPEIQNGTSNVAIFTVNGNATVGIGGTSNVAVFATTGAYVKGVLSATGNVRGAYILGNGSQLTGLPATYTDANVTALLSAFGSNVITTTGNVTGGNLISTNGIRATGDIISDNVYPTGVVSALGNVTGANLNTNGQVRAGANIVAGEYFVGDGRYLTNIPGTGGDGTQISNGLSSVSIPVSSGNVTVTVGFAPNVVVFSTNGVNVSGTVTATDVNTTSTISATGTVTGGNLITAGAVSAIGNITGDYLFGNGYYLTGVTGGGGTNYTNANVAAFLPTYTGNISAGNISVTGNITGNLTGVVTGQLNGLINGVNPDYGTWDFGYIVADTYTNPIQWIFAVTPAGNIDMGTVVGPAVYEIDIGTIF